MKANIMDLSLFNEWLGTRNLKDSTIYIYIQVITKFLSFNPEIDVIDDYNNFIIEGAIKKRNTHYYSVLKNFIEFKFKNNDLKNKLIGSLIKPPIRHDYIRERRHLSDEEIMEVINSIKKKKHRILALIQTLTGVRAGDVLGLEEGSIMPEKYEGKEVLRLNIIGKGNKRNVVFIHNKVAQQVIWDYILNSNPITNYYFLEKGAMRGREGTLDNKNRLMKMNYVWYWYDLKQALDAYGINKTDFASHDFRRCFARKVWERWKDVHVLKKILNHVDASTTLRYLEQSGLHTIDYHKELQGE